MLATRPQLQKYISSAPTAAVAGASVDPDLLDLVLAGASDRITEAAPDRTLELLPAVGEDPVELTIPARWQSFVRVPDLRELVALTIDGQTVDIATADLVHRPRELCALWIQLPQRARRKITVVGHWGPAGAKVGTADEDLDVRGDIRDACLVWAARAYHNRTARFADSVQDPAGGVSNYFRNLPPDVKIVVDGLEIPGL